MNKRSVWNAALGRGSLCLLLSMAGALQASTAAPEAAPGAGAATDAMPGATVPAMPGTWQKHQYSFAFLGFTSTYSCDGLASQLKVLLLAAGARADVKATAGACAAGFGTPDKFARSDLTFFTLTPATVPPATVPPAATPDGTGASAPGLWRPIALAARRPRELTTGDCELVEQFKSSVLPLFATRNLDNHTTCVPHQESGSVIDLKFESFTAVPQKVPGA